MSKKKNRKNRAKQRNFGLVILCAVAVLAVVGLLVGLSVFKGGDPAEKPETSTPVQIENHDKVNIDLGWGLVIRDVANYSGVYMEDGTDDIVSGVLMIVVKNTGKDDVQYAEIELAVGAETACFQLTTLPAGEAVVLLEKNRMPYQNLQSASATAKNVAVFQAPVSICEDKLDIQALNGILNVTNISGADITGDIVIYYKNSAADLYYGGITYRVRIGGGMKAGEIKQIMASHFSGTGSKIVFVTVGQ